MLHWNLIFCILIIECVLVLLLVLPLPRLMKRSILEGISKLWSNFPVKIAAIAIVIGIGVLFFDSLRDSSYYKDQIDFNRGADVKAGYNLHSRLLGAQRNAYISGFALFLLFCIYRFEVMLRDQVDAESKLAVAIRQKEINSKEHEKLLKEKEELETERERLRRGETPK
eukprot:TRINITY_DN16276_c0_g1_i1.p1 TRINITY_DN16276_c0_g1~~TRINITY_DN16276_c0_g1_i1.p1  ORF type:complete len:169 (-),score=20.38 TRINITY_DN16276_c0_g1_i1:23-529(-)